jgi:hypothetical protein
MDIHNTYKRYGLIYTTALQHRSRIQLEQCKVCEIASRSADCHVVGPGNHGIGSYYPDRETGKSLLRSEGVAELICERDAKSRFYDSACVYV